DFCDPTAVSRFKIAVAPPHTHLRRHPVFFLVCLCVLSLVARSLSDNVYAGELHGIESSHDVEFSARLIWRTGKRLSKAQLFVKKDRYRIEHLAGIKTDLGYATVTIVRLDIQKVWYILSQRRLVMAVPLTTDHLLPLSVRLEGEVARTRIGDAMVGEQAATLYDVRVDRNGHQETYYEWVDESRQLLLKLVSQDRDWSVEYDRVIQSKQPDYFFETPLGYRKIEATEKQVEEG
ncbi:MAG: hypothetical protein ACE1ZO_03865, partial [Nitrospirales bacterium]